MQRLSKLKDAAKLQQIFNTGISLLGFVLNDVE